MLGRISAVTALLVAMFALPSPQARDYHVSPTGSDTDSGSVTKPYKTIAKACAVAVAGDRCYIHAGTYYESLRPTNSGSSGSPISFVGYGDGESVVHGGSAVTGWTLSSGNIYKAPVSGTVKEVFANRKYMVWARHPNIPYDPVKGFNLLAPRLNTATAPQAIDYTNVWYMHSAGQGWVYEVVQRSTYVNDPQGCLIGVPGLLDAEGEWCVSSGQLYFYAPGGVNPNTILVETKLREFGVDLSSRNYITLRGITVLGTSINMNTSDRCIVDSCTVLYHGSIFAAVGSTGGFHRDNGNSFSVPGKGVVMGGTNCEIRNCVIAHSWGDGITIYGSGNKVNDCEIYDCDWSATDCAPIGMSGSAHTITRNTLYESGRSILVHRRSTACQITYNDLGFAGRMVYDLGVTYTFNSNGNGSVISYNWVHDNVAAGEGGAGIYLDNNSTSYTVHHNVIWNIAPGGGKSAAFGSNSPSTNLVYYNNTLLNNNHNGGMAASVANCSGIKYTNNIFDGPATEAGAGASGSSTTYTSNYEGHDPGFVDADAPTLDFRLMQDASCRDAGTVVSGITDGYSGTAPDVGAYEYGVEPWVPGRGTDASYTKRPVFTPPGGYVFSPMQVTITSSSTGSVIRYTTDGSQPTATSAIAAGGAITVSGADTVWARAYRDNLKPGRAAAAVFRLPRNPDNPVSTAPGMQYKSCTWAWPSTPSTITGLQVGASGVTDSFNISLRHRTNYLAMGFYGYLDVPTDGVYTFYLSVDGGASFTIGTTKVCGNVNPTTQTPGNERAGRIGLRAGKHAFSVVYSDTGGISGLRVNWRGPGIAKQSIPRARLLHDPTTTSIEQVGHAAAPRVGVQFVAGTGFVLTGKGARFSVFGADGRSVASCMVSGSRAVVPLSRLRPGMAVYRLELPDGRVSHGSVMIAR